MSDEKNRNVSDARLRCLESVFGKCDKRHLKPSIPFKPAKDLGASPDVVRFPHFINGKLYVTTALVGSTKQKPNTYGNYELAIAHQRDQVWGVDIIYRLASYSIKNVIDDGEMMDIAQVTPSGSTIESLLFKRIASFEFQAHRANVICCIGITKVELDYCLDKGTDAFLKKFPQDLILTDLYRKSYV